MSDINIHFSREEFAQRQDRVRMYLTTQGLDGLLLFKIEDMYWLTGYDSDGFSIFGCMFIGTDGQLTHLARPAGTDLPGARLLGPRSFRGRGTRRPGALLGIDP